MPTKAPALKKSNYSKGGSLKEEFSLSKQKLDLLTQNTTYGVYEINFDPPKFLFINDAMCKGLGYTHSELLKKDPFEILTPESRKKFAARIEKQLAGKRISARTEYCVLTKKGLPRWVVISTIFIHKNGKPKGAFVLAQDVTDSKKDEEILEQLRERLEIEIGKRTSGINKVNKRLKGQNIKLKQNQKLLKLEESRLEALLQLNQLGTRSIGRVTNFTLEKAIELTNSKIGFLGFLDKNETIYKLSAVSKKVNKGCRVHGSPMQWKVSGAGIWADAIRKRKTIYVNDYKNTSLNKKGIPKGHLPIRKFMVVPVFENKKIVTLIGVANKFGDYDKSDERQVFLLLQGMWNSIQRNLTEKELRKARIELELKVKERTEKLRESIKDVRKKEERLRLAQLYSGIGIWDWDIKNNNFQWSEGLYKLFGLDEKKVKASFDLWKKITFSKDRNVTEKRIKQAVKHHELLDSESRIVLPSGEIRWIRALGKAKYRKGKPVRMLGICMDITERTKAKELVKEQNMFLENLLDAIPVPVFYKNEKGFYTGCNAAFESFMGLKEKDIIGKDVYAISPKHLADMYYERDVEMFTKMENQVYEGRVKHSDGKEHDVIFYKKLLLDEHGKILGLIGAILDISQRKEVEDKLRETNQYLQNLFNYANAPIICWDKDFKIIKFNRALERLTGYREIDVLGKNLGILFPEKEKQGQMLKIKRAFKGEYWEEAEIPIRRSDGQTRIILWNSANILSESGKDTLATIAQGQDITERVLLEEQKNEFINIASHELKTPLTSLKAFAQILSLQFEQPSDKMSKVDKRSTRILKGMEDQIDKLTNLVVTMLDVTKIQSGKLVYKNDIFAIDGLIKKAVRDVAITVGNEYKFKVNCKTGVRVKGDKFRISQVLANLLTNAVKYSPDNKNIVIKTKRNNKNIIVSVQDFGIGIPKKDIPVIFTKFYRVQKEQRITSGFTNMGLGLYISSEIIKRHGGKIWLESKYRKGSTFYFSLPIES